MRSAIRKPCTNSEKFTYTGQEQSPLGLGIAPGGKLDTLYHVGRNNKMWMAVASHNGDMVWKPVPEDDVLKADNVPVDKNEEPIVEEAVNKKPVKKEEVEEKHEEVVKKTVKKTKKEKEVVSEEPKPVKKKATKKETGGGDDEKPKKTLTDYQKYMSWRMSQIIAEEHEQKITRTQPERMRFIADEWKTIKVDEDKRKSVMEKVNASK